MARRGCGERDGHSSATPVARRLKQPTRTATRKKAGACAPCRPYSVLLPVGFAVPLPLPEARCALTAPFHPCLGQYATRRGGLFSVALSLGLTPAGRYPAPFIRGARTFLPGHLSVIAGAAVRPTDGIGVGPRARRRQDAGLGLAFGLDLRLARLAFCAAELAGASSLRSVSRVEVSAMPSTCAGRKWRWNAVTTCLVASS